MITQYIPRFALFALGFIAISRPSSADVNPLKYSGEQGRIIKFIEQSSRAHNYKAIVSLLDRDYTDVVDTKAVVAKSQSIQWELTDVSVGTAEQFVEFAFIPIRAKVLVGDRSNFVDSVLFFKISGGKWTLINFPFLPDYFPSFGSIPMMKSE